jgi:hypothetical protein
MQAVGVGQRFTAVANPSPLVLLAPLRLWFPHTVGVGHITCASRPRFEDFPSGRMCRTVPVVVWYRLPPVIGFASVAQGVTHNPDAFALVRCAGMGRGYNAPFRSEPQRGKVAKDSVESSKSEHWGILHEDVAGSNFANNPGHVRP